MVFSFGGGNLKKVSVNLIKAINLQNTKRKGNKYYWQCLTHKIQM